MNTQIDGRNAYATSDLLVPHPTKSGLWKIYGRKDDQIMLSTGEKTNPGPLGKTITFIISNTCSNTEFQREFCVRIVISCPL